MRAPVVLACEECSLRQNPAFIPVTRDEFNFIANCRQENTTIRRGAELIDLRLRQRQILTITKGWAFHYVIGPAGYQSIRDFLLPGNCVHFDASQFEGPRISGVRALTEIEACVLSQPEMSRVFESQPELTRKLVRTLYLDNRRLDRRQAAFARGNASQRAAYLFLELLDRTRPLALGGSDWFTFPARRQHLEDALGLSRAQLSRALGQLRDSGLASFERGMVKIKDRRGLELHSGYSSLPEGGRLLL